MVESDCTFHGNVLLSEQGVAGHEECLQLSEIIHGEYHVYEDVSQTCTILDSGARTCNTIRGVDDVSPTDC